MKKIYLSDLATGRENNFDLIRHVAAVGVLVSHAYPVSFGRGYQEPIGDLLGVTLGSLCVAAFFALSGFLVTASWHRFEANGGGWRGFLAARALRIVPGLVAVVLVTVLLGAMLTVVPISQYLAGAAVYATRTMSLVSISQYLPGVFETTPMDGTINGSLWTLFYEVSLYLAVMVAGLVGLMRHRMTLVASAIVLFGIYVVSSRIHLSDRLHAMSLLGIPFAAGSLAWVWKDKIRCTALWVVASWFFVWLSLEGPISAPAVYLAIAVTILYLGHLKPRPIKWPPRFDLSYGIYIYAFPMQQIAAQFGPHNPVANISLALPPTILFAWLSWHYIEEPALAFKSKKLKLAT